MKLEEQPQAVRFFAAWFLVLWGCWPMEQPEARTEGLAALTEAFQ